MLTKIVLPEGIKETELGSVTFEHGVQILRYGRTCKIKPDCGMNQDIRDAMGENYPCWFDKFILVKIQTPYRLFSDSVTMVFCSEYQNPQQRLVGISQEFIDGVEQLVEVTRIEKAKYLEGIGEV